LSTFKSDIREDLCLRYSKKNGVTANCETVGETRGSGSLKWFEKLRTELRIMLPNFIPYCIGYNSRGFCDYCVKGRAFNGRSCEKCIIRPVSEGLIKSEHCEYPWEDIVRAMYLPRQNGVLGHIKDRCRNLLFKKGRTGASQWDHCIRMVSRYQYPMLIITPKARGKSYTLQARGSFLNWTRQADKDSSSCDDVYTQGVCNCYATTMNRKSCAQCDIGFTREGVLQEEMIEDEYFTSDKDDAFNTETWGSYSNFKCSKSKIENCAILRPNWDVNGDEFQCSHCDIKNHFKQAADGSCVNS